MKSIGNEILRSACLRNISFLHEFSYICLVFASFGNEILTIPFIYIVTIVPASCHENCVFLYHLQIFDIIVIAGIMIITLVQCRMLQFGQFAVSLYDCMYVFASVAMV